MKRGLGRDEGCVLEPAGDSLSEAPGWPTRREGEVRVAKHGGPWGGEFVWRGRFIVLEGKRTTAHAFTLMSDPTALSWVTGKCFI